MGRRSYLQEPVYQSDSSLGSGNDLALHFGLGSDLPQSARILWPDSTEITIDSPPYDQAWRLVYPSCTEFVFADGFESGDATAWRAPGALLSVLPAGARRISLQLLSTARDFLTYDDLLARYEKLCEQLAQEYSP